MSLRKKSPPPNGSFPSSASSIISTSSSSYRHHHASLQIHTTPDPPKRVLLEDEQYSPKTRGCVGILLVGLGGCKATTLVASVLGNRSSLKWKGPKGEERHANLNGCATQSTNIQGLANANMAAVGGWDVSAQKLGTALKEEHVLDHDLVSQVQDELNKIRVFKGYYDERFSGSIQPSQATHVLQEKEVSEALKYLRADIRYFKWRNGVVGHTTVIWSASVEFDCELPYQTARELLEAIEQTEQKRGRPLPPSLIYATAALLEGCSFVNGGSQNTLSCKGLEDLAQQQLGVYCLGSDFNAGQATMTTAAIDYLTTMGLSVNAAASDNNVVEYNCSGFLDQELTMVTYTRGASDAILCVPLMIDVAVWCDFFANRSWPSDKVAKALAHLFKTAEGAATQSNDVGMYKQMEFLQAQAQAASDGKMSAKKKSSATKRRVRIRPEEKTTEWAIPHDASIICAGLACVDMQLNQASGGDGGEGIETFAGEKSIGGGSVSMACKTLARLCHGAPLNDDFMQVTPPVVNSVVPLCKIGKDDTGNKLLSLLEACGSASRNVETKYIRNARSKDSSGRTALAVLPIYKDGRRGCFFDAASNDTFSPFEMLEMINSLSSGANGPDLDKSELSCEDVEHYQDQMEALTPDYGAFLFGYPHLLPQMQGEGLVGIFQEARYHMLDGGIVALDLNGVPEASFKSSGGLRTLSDLKNDPVIGAALPHVDILHMNEDELMLLTGCEIEGTDASQLEDEYIIARAVNLFLLCGVAVVAITRGKRGSFVSCNDEERFSRSRMLPSSWVDCTAKIGAAELPPGTVINTNGAGDSFTSGLLVASLLRHTGMKIPTPKSEPATPTHGSEQSFSFQDISPRRHAGAPSRTPTKKSTPYQLYMKENYVSLKKQCKDDKKAIFAKCHEMWETESDEVKALYERKAEEESAAQESEASLRLMDDSRSSASTPRQGTRSDVVDSDDDDEDEVKQTNMYMTNRALNLESAVLFASLVALHHIDVSTRDLPHIDVIRLLERSMIFPHGLEEI